MNKKLKIVLICIISTLTLVGTFFAGFFVREFTIDKDARSAMYLIEKYKKHYYFEEDGIVDIISNSLLDKYSSYYSKEEYDLIKRSAKGYTEGVGLTFYSDTSVISEVLSNSPAERVGVTKNGEVIAYNTGGGMVTPVNTNDVLNALKSASKGAEITLKIKYGTEEKIFTCVKNEYLRTYVKYQNSSGTYVYQGESGDIKRTKITEESPVFSQKAGYIKYSAFNGKDSGLNGSYGQLKDALEYFKSENKEVLVFDLRGNGGGYLDILNDVASLIVPYADNGKFLTQYSKDKYNNVEEYFSKNSQFLSYGIKKLIVMVDENSASASEALVGAIYDYSTKINFDLKIIISSSILNGEKVYKSYGKGIMQTTYPNADGSAVKLTTAKLYWPISNVSIHGVGITTSIIPTAINADAETALSVALSYA